VITGQHILIKNAPFSCARIMPAVSPTFTQTIRVLKLQSTVDEPYSAINLSLKAIFSRNMQWIIWSLVAL